MSFSTLGIDLVAKIAKFEEDMAKATKSVVNMDKRVASLGSTFKKVLGGVGIGFTVKELGSLVKSGIDFADTLNDMSERLGVSVKDLASFKLAAEQSGTSLDSVGAGIARLSRSIGEAERDNKKMAAALSDLGITARDPKEAFFQLADAVKRIEDPSRRATLLNDVLGKSYAELVPLLNQGSEALRKSAQDSESFAESMARLAPEADKFNDQLAVMKQNLAGLAGAALGPAVKSLNQYAAAMKDVVANGTALQKLAFFTVGFVSEESLNRISEAGDRVQDYNVKIFELQQQLVEFRRVEAEGSPNIRIWEDRISALAKTRDELIAQARKDAAAAAKSAGGGDGLINYGKQLQDALRKGLSTAPFDDFLKTFKDRRKAISAEYQALKAELSGASGGAVTSLDVSREITLGSGALAGGDLEAAQAAAKRAKELFKQIASNEGTAGFEKSYFLRELERLETDALGAAESTAVKLKQTIEQQLAQLNTDATKLEVAVDETGIVNQVKKAIDDARKALQDNPLVIPIVGVPSISSDGRQGVDISTAARQYGGRR